MGRKTGWEGSTKSPDWTDVATMMRAMGALHSGAVGATVLPLGTGSNGGVSVAVSIMFDVLPGSSLPDCVAVSKPWPCTSHKTLAAHVFALLYELDYKISAVYQQESLWK